MYNKLKKIGFYEKEGTKHMRLGNKYNDYVNAIGSKCANKLPKREHGWYISKDDQNNLINNKLQIIKKIKLIFEMF